MMKRCCLFFAIAFATSSNGASAQQTEPVKLQDIEVIAITPVLGASLPKDRVASSSYTASGAMLQEARDWDLASSLRKLIPSVSVIDAQNSPLQRDLHYRGYTASPLLGLPQGLAVYQNGVRVNEPFGDVVQWDGIPEFAVQQAQMISGANPIFGLNALGGALALRMKNGFDNKGISAEIGGGQFGRVEGIVESGWSDKNWAVYAGYKGAYDEGYREFSESNYHQFFADTRYRGKKLEMSVDITAGVSDINGNGVTPVDLIAKEGRKAVFTHPDKTENMLVGINSTFNFEVDSKISIQGNAYFRDRERDTTNGDEFELEECEIGGEEYLAAEEGSSEAECGDERYRDANNQLIEKDDYVEALNNLHGLSLDEDDLEDNGGAYNRSTTESQSGGFNLQATYEDRFKTDWGSFDNILIGGMALDMGEVSYNSSSEIGFINATRGITLSGITIGTRSEEGAPVGLDTSNTHFGLYLMDVMALTDDVDVTLAGRWNWTKIEMKDQQGTALNGNHVFQRFNPSVGVVWRALDVLQLYGNYSQSSRAPTAAELGCADEKDPCRLPNAFLADPPLEQVRNRSFEVGLRGNAKSKNLSWEWSAAYFHGVNRNDILFIAGSQVGTGYFQNVGDTKRQGGEFLLAGRFHDFTWRFHYSFLEATFETDFEVSSEAHDNADSNSKIQVSKGNRIPGIPKHSGGFFVGYDILPELNVGLDVIVSGEQYYRGDESNQLETLDAYAVVSLHSRYRFHDNGEVFLRMDNLFDQEYETFGIIADPSEVDFGVPENQLTNRFQSVGLPFGVYGGVRFKY